MTTVGSATHERSATAHSLQSSSTRICHRGGGASRRPSSEVTWRLILARLIPAASLTMLMVWQLTALLADSKTALAHPNWLVIAGFARAILYAAFLSILVVAVLLRKQPFDCDGRLLIRGAAVTGSFLLVVLGLLAPAGPLLLRMPALITSVAAVITLGGAVLALAAAYELGTNFSFGPQSRQLVVTGPYRLIRHPMYLAELLMSTGVVMVVMHLTVVIGLCAVIAFQVVRISAEEKLLMRTIPTYGTYARATRCRLIPSLW